MDREQNTSLKRYLEAEGIGAAHSDCRIIDPLTGSVIKTIPAVLFDEPMSAFMKGYRDRQRR